MIATYLIPRRYGFGTRKGTVYPLKVSYNYPVTDGWGFAIHYLIWFSNYKDQAGIIILIFKIKTTDSEAFVSTTAGLLSTPPWEVRNGACGGGGGGCTFLSLLWVYWAHHEGMAARVPCACPANLYFLSKKPLVKKLLLVVIKSYHPHICKCSWLLRLYGGLFHHLYLNQRPGHSLIPFFPKLWLGPSVGALGSERGEVVRDTKCR